MDSGWTAETSLSAVRQAKVANQFGVAVNLVENDDGKPDVLLPEEPCGFAPTGTHADVLEAAAELSISIRSRAVEGLVNNVLLQWRQYGAAFGLPAETMAQAWEAAARYTLERDGGVWVSGLVTDMIEDLAEQLPGESPEGLPELTMEETGLPRSGIVLFGRPIRDRSSSTTHENNLWLTGIAWAFFSEMTQEQAAMSQANESGARWAQAPAGSGPDRTAGVILTPLIVTDQVANGDPVLSKRMLATANGGKVMPTMPTARPGAWWDLSTVTNAEDVTDAAQWIPRLFAALTMWMRSKITDDEQVERRVVKRVARRSKLKTTPAVRTVKLRKIEADPDHEPVPSGKARKAYSHRFIVGPFPRNQPYGPGRAYRRRVIVGPFVKGPDHLPIMYKKKIIKVDR